jgi:ABC-2 type transport system permease protein
MSPRRTLATARRVLLQLRHDPRTIILILFVPVVLMTLLRYVLNDAALFSREATPILGVFPFTVMFIVASITTLRERTSGTLERLLTMPIAKLDLLLGYGLAFGIMAMAQALIVSWVALGPLGLSIQGHAWLIVVVAVLNSLLGTALGLFISAFATTEFQAVQFMPAFVLPQLLVCGLFVPRDQMTTVLRWFSDITPLYYAVNALQQIATHTNLTGLLVRDMIVVAGVALVALALGAATLKRRSA